MENTQDKERQESQPMESAFQVVRDAWETATPTTSLQRIKRLADGTEIIINRYIAKEDINSDELETFDINVLNKNYGGILFTSTKNGLTRIEIQRKLVTLRSHLYPRPGEDLEVVYDSADKSKTPLGIFREAIIPLAEWLDYISTHDKPSTVPISIIKKKSNQ